MDTRCQCILQCHRLLSLSFSLMFYFHHHYFPSRRLHWRALFFPWKALAAMLMAVDVINCSVPLTDCTASLIDALAITGHRTWIRTMPLFPRVFYRGGNDRWGPRWLQHVKCAQVVCCVENVENNYNLLCWIDTLLSSCNSTPLIRKQTKHLNLSTNRINIVLWEKTLPLPGMTLVLNYVYLVTNTTKASHKTVRPSWQRDSPWVPPSTTRIYLHAIWSTRA